MARAVILTGGNIGDMELRLEQARRLIESEIGTVLRCSRVYVSEAWGFGAEDGAQEFSNQAMVVETGLAPHALLESVLGIEKKLGRDRGAEASERERTGERYASRVVDIDIIMYGDAALETAGLTIPHPLMHEREFVLDPVCEIAPDMIHPVFRKSIFRLRGELAARSKG